MKRCALECAQRVPCPNPTLLVDVIGTRRDVDYALLLLFFSLPVVGNY